jgi:hypothetical protein
VLGFKHRFAFKDATPAFSPFSSGWQSLWLAIEDVISSHACWLEVSTRVINSIPLGCPFFLPGHAVNHVATLQADKEIMKQAAC